MGILRRNGKRIGALNSEINITPFVDILLVVLLIFMISSSVMIHGINVNLPKADSKQISTNEETITISVDRKGDVFVQQAKVTRYSMPTTLSAISKNNRNIRIYISADKNSNYGTVLDIFGIVRKAGFKNAVLVTEE